MEAMQVTTQMTPCSSPLPELEIPMINTMVTCLGSGHRKLNGLIMQLAFAVTRPAGDPDAVTADQRAVEVWDEIRRDLWSHLQIEDELVFSWGEAHHVIPGTLLETLKIERQEIRKLVAALPALSSVADREPQTAGDRGAFARTMLALARTLDLHVERYDGEVLPFVGHGHGVWSFVHIEDAARATVAALTAAPGVYNVVDDDPSPVSRWLPPFAQWVGAPPPPHMTEQEAREVAGEDAVYYGTKLRGASNEKARKVLHFRPRRLQWLLS